MLKSLNKCDLTPRAEIERRIGELKAGMAKNGIDFAVIAQNVDMFYFAGTIQKGALIVPLEGDPILFIERTIERAMYESPLKVNPIKKDKDIKGLIAGKNILKGRGGMELDVMPVAVFERWKSILGLEAIVDLTPIIKDVRLIKSPFEIEQIKASGRIVSRVFQRAKGVVKEGVREAEIASLLEAEGKAAGHQGFLRMRGWNQEMMSIYVLQGLSGTLQSHMDIPIAGIGATHAMAQGPSINRIRRDIPLIIDYGGGYNGYSTDETRAFAMDRMKEVYQRAYDTAREIVEDTQARAKEGVNGTEVFNNALGKVKAAGLEDYFMGYGDTKVGFMGHGIGLEINELPVITPRHSVILKEGMVFAIEPKFIIPGEGVMGLEVDFIVRKDGVEKVTDFPLDVVYV